MTFVWDAGDGARGERGGCLGMMLPINATFDGTAFSVTVSMPNNAQLCNIVNGGGHYPSTGVLTIYELAD